MADFAPPTVSSVVGHAFKAIPNNLDRDLPHLRYQRDTKQSGMVSAYFSASPELVTDSRIADQYKEWFYVNIYTKKSQWEKPTKPIYAPDEEAPAGPPPLYNQGDAKPVEAEKSGLSSNNPYASATGGVGSSHDISEDERLARKLQEEENARAQDRPTSRGASDSYYQQQAAYGQPAGYGRPEYTPTGSPMPMGPPFPEDKGKAKGGFLGKLLGKGSHPKPQYDGYPPQQQYYGGPPQGQYGGYPPQQGYYQGYPPQQQYGPPKKSGMGVGTAAALGVGGGLLGGVLLGEAIEGGDDGGYGDDGGDF